MEKLDDFLNVKVFDSLNVCGKGDGKRMSIVDRLSTSRLVLWWRRSVTLGCCG